MLISTIIMSSHRIYCKFPFICNRPYFSGTVNVIITKPSTYSAGAISQHMCMVLHLCFRFCWFFSWSFCRRRRRSIGLFFRWSLCRCRRRSFRLLLGLFLGLLLGLLLRLLLGLFLGLFLRFNATALLAVASNQHNCKHSNQHQNNSQKFFHLSFLPFPARFYRQSTHIILNL